MAQLNGFKMKSLGKILFFVTIAVSVFEAECDTSGINIIQLKQASREYLTVLEHRAEWKPNKIHPTCDKIRSVLHHGTNDWVYEMYLTPK